MLGVPSLFTYRYEVDLPGLAGKRAIVFAYKPPGVLPTGSFEVLLDVARKQPVVPDAIVVVQAQEDAVDLNFESSEALKIAKSRLEGRTALIHAQASLSDGKITCKSLDSSARAKVRPYFEHLKALPRAWLAAGLKALFEPQTIILKAPPGYAYQKPSGKKEQFFIKPDLALKTSSGVAFVAFCAFLRMFSGHPSKLRELETVFLDTMAIAPVAYALKELVQLSDHSNGPFGIESFHSYGGMEHVKLPIPGTSFCIISASTSLSMHEQWMSSKGVRLDEVMTLVSVLPVKRYEQQVLHACEPPHGLSSEGPPQLSIRLTGELFMPEQELPKKVLLREPVHGRVEVMKFLREHAPDKLLDVFRPAVQGTPVRRRQLYVDGEVLLKLNDFDAWLAVRLLRRVRAATQFIVHQDDPSSLALAQRVQSQCASKLGLGEVVLVRASEVSTTTFAEGAAVVVCAAVIGRGAQLLSVSRALRDKNVGARLYLVGVQLCETEAEFSGLKTNLEHDHPVKHEVEVFKQIYVGSQLAASFLQELKTYYGHGVAVNGLPQMLRERAKRLMKGMELFDRALLPRGDGQPLSLRATFAYWPGEYDAGPWHAEVLATAGLLLQRARESKEIKGEADRLSSPGFRHVLLDPENFSRYNDGIIQAALLRCAYASELDYRADAAASSFMTTLILRGLERITDDAGEASLEFLLALALKKLQLAPGDLEAVLDRARQLTLSKQLRQAVNFILGPLSTTETKQQTNVPF
jgi:hypothetical protein